MVSQPLLLQLLQQLPALRADGRRAAAAAPALLACGSGQGQRAARWQRRHRTALEAASGAQAACGEAQLARQGRAAWAAARTLLLGACRQLLRALAAQEHAGFWGQHGRHRHHLHFGGGSMLV